MAVDEILPSEALPLAIWVLVYSLINLLASLLVVVMRWRASDEKFDSQYHFSSEVYDRTPVDLLFLVVIPMAAIVISVGIVCSMSQQVHFIVSWKDIRDAAYESAVNNPIGSAATFMSTYNETDTNLFLIRKLPSHSCEEQC
jgi:hypothetical protein